MKVVVTGGSGRLGQYVIQDLLARGHEVLSLDRVPPPNKTCASWIADLRNAGDLYQALRGAQAVVHLGAWQAPGMAPDTETFSNNVTATYSVLHAAQGTGVKRVVVGSSIAAYGFIYAASPPRPDYLPLDEEHPCAPEDPYGLSKVVGELTATAFAGRGGLSVVSLRLPGINFDLSYQGFRDRWRDPGARRARGGFWTYVDARDAAAACRLAVEARLEGHRVFNVAAPRSSMPWPTDALVQRFLGEGIPRRGGPLAAHWSAMDSTRAQRELGFRAEHEWQRYLDAENVPPL